MEDFCVARLELSVDGAQSQLFQLIHEERGKGSKDSDTPEVKEL